MSAPRCFFLRQRRTADPRADVEGVPGAKSQALRAAKNKIIAGRGSACTAAFLEPHRGGAGQSGGPAAGKRKQRGGCVGAAAEADREREAAVRQLREPLAGLLGGDPHSPLSEGRPRFPLHPRDAVTLIFMTTSHIVTYYHVSERVTAGSL